MAERSKTARQQVDPVFKQVLLDELTPLTKALQTEIEVSRLPRTIDALVTLATADELQSVQTSTPFFLGLTQYAEVRLLPKVELLW